MSGRGDDREFVDAVRVAVQRSLGALRDAHPAEKLAGYVLFTDDRLGTLFHRAVTREALSANSESDLLFSQADWPYEEGSHYFGSADELLRKRADAAEEFGEHVRSAFSDLVRALAGLKELGVFDPSVFLSVASTDPGSELQRLEQESIDGLNPPELARSRRAFVAEVAKHEESEWEEIHGFAGPSEYRRFIEFIDRQVAGGVAVEVPADPSYGPGMLHGGRWFRDAASGEVWRLVPPDPPFLGVWEPVASVRR